MSVRTPDPDQPQDPSPGPTPGWLSDIELEEVRRRLPLLYVEAIPVRVDGLGVVTEVGILLRATATGQMTRTLLATDPALLSQVEPDERRRAALILDGLMPISRKVDGLRTDAFWAGAPSSTAHDRIEVPTLLLSCEDDLFGTADTARRLADRIPGAMLKIWPDGGHIWLGHDADVAREIAAFVAPPGWSPAALSP